MIGEHLVNEKTLTTFLTEEKGLKIMVSGIDYNTV